MLGEEERALRLIFCQANQLESAAVELRRDGFAVQPRPATLHEGDAEQQVHKVVEAYGERFGRQALKGSNPAT